MDKIYFNCNACGKCCNTPPTFLFSDFMKYSKEFIIAIKLTSAKRSGKKLKNEDDLYQIQKHNDRIYPIVNNNMTIAFPYGLKTGPYCPKLLPNGQCSIYESRPTRCRSVPFQATVPESFLLNGFGGGLSLFMKQGCITTQPKDGFIKIYDENKITNKDIKKSIDIEIKSFMETKSLVMIFVNYLKKNGTNIQRNEYDIAAGLFVAMLAEIKKISHEEAIEYFQNQNNLINATISIVKNPYELELIKDIQILNSVILKDKFNITL